MRRFIADTSVWSLFLSRSNPSNSDLKARLRAGILSDEVQMLGVIRQECLSGIKEREQYNRVREYLNGFPDLLATSDDHLMASEFHNSCRRNGLRGGCVEFLICAQSVSSGLPILTIDQNFQEYQKYLPISLLA